MAEAAAHDIAGSSRPFRGYTPATKLKLLGVDVGSIGDAVPEGEGFDELVVTYFTRGPTSETLPVKVYGMARVGLSPELNTISTVLVVITAMIVVAAETLKKAYKD